MSQLDDLIDYGQNSITSYLMSEDRTRHVYVLDYLILLRSILNTGDCNICAKKNQCEYVPKPGQMVRYNCPFYKKEKED